MQYGIEQNILSSPFSLVVSIALCVGLTNFGYIVQKYFFRNILLLEFKKNYFFFSPLVGIYAIIFPLYLILIFELNFQLVIKIISIFLIILAVIPFFYLRKISKLFIDLNNLSNKKTFLFVAFIYLLLFLISASPITHADALGYHFSGALNLLHNGHLNKDILPMNYNIVSIGEIIIALGLSLKAEQFGGIVQFLSLLSLIPIFQNEKLNKIFLIFVLVCPVTFFLVSSPKPQLIFCISTFLIFIFLTKGIDRFNYNQIKIIFLLAILILAINSLAKFSFILSSTLIGIYFFYQMYNKKLFFFSVFSILVIFCITFLPNWFFRYEHFGTGIYDLIRSPYPLNIYGYEEQNILVSGGTIQILGVFFPITLKTFSSSFGPLLIFLPFLANKKVLQFKIPIFLTASFIILVFIFGGNLPRFLYEAYLWIIYLVSKNIKNNSIFFKTFKKLTYIQSFFIILIYCFFVIKIFPGSLSQELKHTVMKQNANGYELADWVNKNLKKEDILLSTHRSISLFNNQTFSPIFAWHIKSENPKSKIYFDLIKSKKINRIVFYDNIDERYFTKCLGKKLFYKKNVGRHVGRNPLNKGDYYDAWIYEFNYFELPGCLYR